MWISDTRMVYCNTHKLGLSPSLGVLCTWMKLSTDWQIFGCELHKNAFGGRAPPVLYYCSQYTHLMTCFP